MRVLHIAHGRIYGGIETLLQTLALQRELCPAMEPQFALCFQGRLSSELVSAGVPVHQLGETRVSRPLSVHRARRALQSVLSSQQYDIVVCHSPWPQAVLGPTARRSGVPLAFWQHGPASGRHWLERWASLCKPRVAVSNSTFTSRTLARIYPRVEHEVVFYPVPPAPPHSPAERSAVRHEMATAGHETVIVQVSRLERWKGQQQLLNALALLNAVPGWVCWFVGGAQRADEVLYFRELEGAVARLRLSDRVRFFGQRSDVRRILSAADIYCQPNSGPEPFGIAFVEALYAGLPVVATAIGGAVEIVDKTCGVLVAPGDDAGLSQVLSRLIVDPGERAGLGTAAPARARHLCDPVTQLGRLERVFARAIS